MMEQVCWWSMQGNTITYLLQMVTIVLSFSGGVLNHCYPHLTVPCGLHIPVVSPSTCVSRSSLAERP